MCRSPRGPTVMAFALFASVFANAQVRVFADEVDPSGSTGATTLRSTGKPFTGIVVSLHAQAAKPAHIAQVDPKDVMRNEAYLDGMLDGASTTYHRNGRVERSTTYKAHIRHGAYVEMNGNGDTLLAGEYSSGEKNGRWIDRKMGWQIVEGYVGGQLDGHYEKRSKAGRILLRGSYHMGKKVGHWESFHILPKEGPEQLEFETEYDPEGRKLFSKEYDGLGNIVREEDLRGDRPVRTLHWRNGNKLIQEQLDSTEGHYRHTVLWPNGSVMLVRNGLGQIEEHRLADGTSVKDKDTFTKGQGRIVHYSTDGRPTSVHFFKGGGEVSPFLGKRFVAKAPTGPTDEVVILSVEVTERMEKGQGETDEQGHFCVVRYRQPARMGGKEVTSKVFTSMSLRPTSNLDQHLSTVDVPPLRIVLSFGDGYKSVCLVLTEDWAEEYLSTGRIKVRFDPEFGGPQAGQVLYSSN